MLLFYLLRIPNNIFLFSAEQISLSLVPFYYVQNVYQKNMPGTRLIIIMISRVIISGKASVVSVNGAAEPGGILSPSAEVLGDRAP